MSIKPTRDDQAYSVGAEEASALWRGRFAEKDAEIERLRGALTAAQELLHAARENWPAAWSVLEAIDAALTGRALPNLQQKIDTIFRLMREVREYKVEHPEERCSHSLGVESILNAYREGDLAFDTAVDELMRWRDLHASRAVTELPAPAPDGGGADAAATPNLQSVQVELQRVKDELTGCAQRNVDLQHALNAAETANREYRKLLGGRK